MYNQHTRGMATTRHRSLVERGGRKALLQTLHTHKKKKIQKKPVFTNLKRTFEHIELPAKLLAHRPSIKGSKLLFPVIKAIKLN